MANVNVEDIKFHQVQKVITCSSDGTWILIICNRSIWLIDAEEGIFRADFRKSEVTVTFQTSRLISITK